MTAKDALTDALKSTRGLIESTLADLSDADFQVRPVPGANNIAWQLGHLIASEKSLGSELGFSYPALPPIVEAMGSGDSAKTHPDGGNLPKEQYLSLFKKVREATIAGVATYPDADLDKPTEGFVKNFAANMGGVLNLIGIHTMMHCGQFSVVRRALGKPVLF